MDYNSTDPAGVPPPYEPVASATTPPGYQQSGYPPPGYVPPVTTSGLSTNTAAALSYITFIPAVIFLVLEPYNKNPFIRFHAFQSIALAVVWFALNIVFAFIPILHFILIPLLGLAMFVLWLITILKAAKGEWFKLPVIGDFALTQSRS